jgi:hypothetical protein
METKASTAKFRASFEYCTISGWTQGPPGLSNSRFYPW